MMSLIGSFLFVGYINISKGRRCKNWGYGICISPLPVFVISSISNLFYPGVRTHGMVSGNNSRSFTNCTGVAGAEMCLMPRNHLTGVHKLYSCWSTWVCSLRTHWDCCAKITLTCLTCADWDDAARPQISTSKVFFFFLNALCKFETFQNHLFSTSELEQGEFKMDWWVVQIKIGS